MDTSSIVSLFSNNARHHGASATLLDECRSLLTMLHSFTIEHIFREANQVVDHLASLGHSISNTFFYSEPPITVGNFLMANVMGISFPRF